MIANYEAVTKVRWLFIGPIAAIPNPHNPATGAIITHLCASSAQEVDGAVQAAEVAYQTIWRWLPSSTRSAYLFKCADALEPHKKELAELLCIKNGKSKADALQFDINFLVSIFRYFASVCDKVLGYLEKAKQSKATIAAQGQVKADPACKNGFFVPPTLIKDVTRDMSLAQEEMFGALVTVMPFETEEEAIAIVNESKYGLTSIIFSSNQERCWRYLEKVDVGMVWVNNYFRNVLGTPFGGAKGSGYSREHCMETLREWSRAKTVNQPSGFGDIPSWRAIKDIFGQRHNEVVFQKQIHRYTLSASSAPYRYVTI
ncbi:aldehyde dehydrogenase [Seiridium cupressi]